MMANPVTYVPIDEMDDIKESPTSHDREVDALLDDLKTIGAAARLDIYKCNPGSKNADMFCDSFPADKFDAAGLQQFIRATWGGGDYRIMVFKPGKRGVSENKLMSIATPKNSNAPAVPNMTGEIGQALTGLAQMMISLSEQQNQRFERLLLELKQPAKDPYEEQKKALEIMKLQREAMGIAGPSQAASPADPIKMMQETLALITSVKTLAGDFGALGGADKPDDSIVNVVREMAPQVLGLIKTDQQIKAAAQTRANVETARRLRNPAPRIGDAGQRPETAPASPALPSPPANTPPIMTREVFQFLQAHAEQDTDTAAVASAIVESYRDEAATILSARRPLVRLLLEYPDAEPFAGWWADLLADLTDALDGAHTGGDANPMPTDTPDQNENRPDSVNEPVAG